MCIDIVEIWFGIADWQILSILDRVICPAHSGGSILLFHIFIYRLDSCLQDVMKFTNSIVGKDYVTPKDALLSMISNHILEKDSCYDPEPDAITDILSHAVRYTIALDKGYTEKYLGKYG